MDVFLTILGLVCIVVGLIGCIIPAIPGPPLSLLGLLLIHWTSYVQYSNTLLLVLTIVAVVVTILDFILPVWITKFAGGSKYATWGATLGLVGGIFFLPPIGIILGPFIGAFVGEIMLNKDSDKALMSALGAFFGFLLGTGLKLIVSAIISFYFFKSLIVYIIEIF